MQYVCLLETDERVRECIKKQIPVCLQFTLHCDLGFFELLSSLLKLYTRSSKKSSQEKETG